MAEVECFGGPVADASEAASQPARVYAPCVKRVKLGPLEIAAGVEPREDPDSAQSSEWDTTPGTDSGSWWWERRKRPLLAEAFVLVFAIGLIAYLALDPHRLSAHPRLIGGLIAAVLLVLVIGWRARHRVSGR